MHQTMRNFHIIDKHVITQAEKLVLVFETSGHLLSTLVSV